MNTWSFPTPSTNTIMYCTCVCLCVRGCVLGFDNFMFIQILMFIIWHTTKTGMRLYCPRLTVCEQPQLTSPSRIILRLNTRPCYPKTLRPIGTRPSTRQREHRSGTRMFTQHQLPIPLFRKTRTRQLQLQVFAHRPFRVGIRPRIM